MADPLSAVSIASGASSIAIQVAQVGKTLCDAATKVKSAELEIISTVSELDAMRLAWEQVEKLLSGWQTNLEADLLTRLQRQISVVNLVMQALADDLAPFQRQSPDLSTRWKFVWNEAKFKDHQNRIRGQSAAMNLMVSVLNL